MKKILIFCLIIIIFSTLAFGFEAQASRFLEGLTGAGNQVDIYSGGPQPISVYAANLVKGFLTLIGILFVVLLIYGGFLYMTSQGKDEQVKKAKNTLTASVIGLVIIVSGYTITYFITSTLENPGGTQPSYRETCENPSYIDYNSLNCCTYRVQVFNEFSPYCCNNYGDFCRTNYTSCGKTSPSECPQ